VVALADVDRGCLDRLGDRYGIERRYGDFRALIDDPQVEAVAVCVPPRSHLEVGLAALDADKHVFLEKPLTADLDECDRLLERARRSSKKVLVGFNMRWHRLVCQMRDTIASGKLDPIQSMWTVFTSDTVHKPHVSEWRKRRELGGGALIEQAVHHFDLWRFLLRSEVEQVFATSASLDWDDETAAVSARMTNGVVVSSLFSEASSNNNEVEVVGRQGRLHLTCYCFDGLEFYSIADAPGALRTRLRSMSLSLRELPRGLRKILQGGEFMSAYRDMWRHFADAIRNDAPVGCSLEDARCTLQVLLAVVESTSRGVPVEVARAARTITPLRGG
jgi:myo-inositol 2-dehydrogenase/D-chiro-inositol 1-dehydrogenase